MFRHESALTWAGWAFDEPETKAEALKDKLDAMPPQRTVIAISAVTATDGGVVNGPDGFDWDVDEPAAQVVGDADPTTAPPWATHVIPAEIAAQHGHSLFLLARTDPAYAPAAIEHLGSHTLIFFNVRCWR